MKDIFLYQKLYNEISARIKNGVYPIGFRLPDEKKLCDEFSVSVITVKKALNLLTEESLVERIPGKGTFVKTPAAPSKAACGHRCIGVIFEHVSSPFGLTMLYKMDAIAEKAGYKLLFRFSYGLRKKEAAEIDFLLNNRVAGIIISPSHGRHYNHEILKLAIEGFPLVLVDKMLHGINIPSVRTDNAAAMRTLVNHMKDRGCRHIGLMTTGVQHATSTCERRDSFYAEIAAQGLHKYNECCVSMNALFDTADVTANIVSEISRYLRGDGAHLDGIICAEYGMVASLEKAAAGLGLVLGKDITVCCVDENDHAHGGYKYSHVKQDEATIAAIAMQLMLDRIGGRAIKQHDFLVSALFHEK